MGKIMKKILLAMSVCMLAFAGQAQAEGRIGVINIEKVMRDSRSSQKSNEKAREGI